MNTHIRTHTNTQSLILINITNLNRIEKYYILILKWRENFEKWKNEKNHLKTLLFFFSSLLFDLNTCIESFVFFLSLFFQVSFIVTSLSLRSFVCFFVVLVALLLILFFCSFFFAIRFLKIRKKRRDSFSFSFLNMIEN